MIRSGEDGPQRGWQSSLPEPTEAIPGAAREQDETLETNAGGQDATDGAPKSDALPLDRSGEEASPADCLPTAPSSQRACAGDKRGSGSTQLAIKTTGGGDGSMRTALTDARGE